MFSPHQPQYCPGLFRQVPEKKESINQKAAVPFPHIEWFPNQKLTNSHAVFQPLCSSAETKMSFQCKEFFKLLSLTDTILIGHNSPFQLKVSWFVAYKSWIELHAKRAQHSEEQIMTLGTVLWTCRRPDVQNWFKKTFHLHRSNCTSGSLFVSCCRRALRKECL